MTLIIDPKTEKGKIQIEAINWMQQQMNQVMMQYFNNTHKLLKGLQVHFELGMGVDNKLNLGQVVKVHVMELIPINEKDFAEAVEDAKKHWTPREIETDGKNIAQVRESLGIDELSPKK